MTKLPKKQNPLPKLHIDLKKIEMNTRNVVKICNKHSIEVSGVTKSTLGDPKIAHSMLRGGATHLADSRIQNIKKMREEKVPGPFLLLRAPMLSEIEEVIHWADLSLNSELVTIKALGKEAIKQKKTHKVIIMIEMGDLREGVLPEDLKKFLTEASKVRGINLFGLGMNLTCYGAIIPTVEKINAFYKVVKQAENDSGLKFKLISGGNSSFLPLLFNKFKNPGITNLRLGESILLGRETAKRTLLKGSSGDAFLLECEIIELKYKDSVPDGVIGKDAFGRSPVFKNQGIILRALAAIGQQDLGGTDLDPIDPNVKILGASSDHLLVHIKSGHYSVGDKLFFSLRYGSLLHTYTSPFVTKVYKNNLPTLLYSHLN